MVLNRRKRSVLFAVFITVLMSLNVTNTYAQTTGETYSTSLPESAYPEDFGAVIYNTPPEGAGTYSAIDYPSLNMMSSIVPEPLDAELSSVYRILVDGEAYSFDIFINENPKVYGSDITTPTPLVDQWEIVNPWVLYPSGDFIPYPTAEFTVRFGEPALYVGENVMEALFRLRISFWDPYIGTSGTTDVEWDRPIRVYAVYFDPVIAAERDVLITQIYPSSDMDRKAFVFEDTPDDVQHSIGYQVDVTSEINDGTIAPDQDGIIRIKVVMMETGKFLRWENEGIWPGGAGYYLYGDGSFALMSGTCLTYRLQSETEIRTQAEPEPPAKSVYQKEGRTDSQGTNAPEPEITSQKQKNTVLGTNVRVMAIVVLVVFIVGFYEVYDLLKKRIHEEIM